jgi:hypothetical protein
VSPALVKLDAGIEPLVRLIEDAPQSDLLEQVARRIRQGASYQQVVAALFLAAVRNVQPRPGVGFKFHAVMVVNAAHMTSLSAPEADRWLPIFWALDEFKTSQGEEQRASEWRRWTSTSYRQRPGRRKPSLPPWRAGMSGWQTEPWPVW